MQLGFARRAATTTRSRLILLVAAILTPLAVFAAILFWRFAVAERARYRAEAQDLAGHVSISIDRDLVTLTGALEALATSPALAQGGDLETFRSQALTLLRTRDGAISLRDPTGQRLIHTGLPAGAPLTRATDPVELAADRAVFETGKPAISGLYASETQGREMVLIAAPVFRGGKVAYALSISVDPAGLANILAASARPGWTVSLVDQNNRVIARSRQHETYVGKSATPGLVRETTGTGGSWEGTTLDGTRALGAYARSPLSGWRTAVGVPVRLIEAPLYRLTFILAGSALLVLVLAVLLARRVARAINVPIRELATAAAQLGRGEAVPDLRTGLREVDEVSGALGAAVAAIGEREAALQASEERFRAAVRAIEGVIWTNDAHGRMTRDQPGWAALTGQSPEAYQGLGWMEAIHPEDSEPTLAAWSGAVREGKTFVFEHRVRRHDGIYRRFSIRAVPVIGRDGAIREWVGVHTDITDEYEAKASLAESQARLRGVFEAVPVGVVIAEAPSGRIVDGNSQAERILGHPILHSETVESYHQWQAFHPDGSRVASEDYPLARVIRQGEERPELEVRYLRGDDGRTVWVRIAGSAIRDAHGTLAGGVVAVVDIDREKRAEAELRELNATLERRVEETVAERDRIWRISTELMLITRFDTSVVAANPAWGATLGWSEAELTGRRFVDLIHPEDLAGTLAETDRLAQGATTLRFENRYRHKDGSYRWLSWTAVPEADLIHAIARDITAEKEADAALQRTEEQLRQSQKMEVVGQLTGGIAHDFNNLLTVVSGNLEMALRRVRAESGNDRLIRNLAAGLEGARRAAALTNRLLAFARQSPLRPETVDLNAIISGMADLIRRTLGEAIRIETRLAEGLWPVEADPNQLENAILNLCVNARDAMPDGGTLTVETRNAVLDEGFAAVARGEMRAGPHAAITVTDTGTGMTPEVRERVFEPFFTTKPVGKGTGLGLSQVFGFLRQSGGYAGIESEPSAGTTVRLFFPRQTEDAAHAPAADALSAEAPGAAGGETILVIEDEDMVREFTVAALEEAGYVVLASGDGPSGLDLLDRRGEIALLFTDVVLAGPMNGSAVAGEAQRRRPGLRVLFTTGYTSGAIMHGGRLDDGVDVITKPFTPAELIEKVQRVLAYK